MADLYTRPDQLNYEQLPAIQPVRKSFEGEAAVADAIASGVPRILGTVGDVAVARRKAKLEIENIERARALRDYNADVSEYEAVLRNGCDDITKLSDNVRRRVDKDISSGKLSLVQGRPGAVTGLDDRIDEDGVRTRAADYEECMTGLASESAAKWIADERFRNEVLNATHVKITEQYGRYKDQETRLRIQMDQAKTKRANSAISEETLSHAVDPDFQVDVIYSEILSNATAIDYNNRNTLGSVQTEPASREIAGRMLASCAAVLIADGKFQKAADLIAQDEAQDKPVLDTESRVKLKASADDGVRRLAAQERAAAQQASDAMAKAAKERAAAVAKAADAVVFGFLAESSFSMALAQAKKSGFIERINKDEALPEDVKQAVIVRTVKKDDIEQAVFSAIHSKAVDPSRVEAARDKAVSRAMERARDGDLESALRVARDTLRLGILSKSEYDGIVSFIRSSASPKCVEAVEAAVTSRFGDFNQASRRTLQKALSGALGDGWKWKLALDAGDMLAAQLKLDRGNKKTIDDRLAWIVDLVITDALLKTR